MSYKDLAEKSEVSTTTLWRLFKSEGVNCNLRTINNLASALGYDTPIEILKEEENK